MMQKPDVEHIDGLSPAISIEQKTTSRNPRSTVATVTEIYDYMRLLWARVGIPYSPATGLPIEAQQVSQMVDRTMQLCPTAAAIILLAPVVRGRKGEYRKELAEWQKAGFTRVRIDGEFYDDRGRPRARQEIQARHRSRRRPHRRPRRHRAAPRRQLRDRAQARRGPRLSRPGRSARRSATRTAVRHEARLRPRPAASSSPRNSPARSRGFTIAEIEPRLFSFNAPQGACPACDGLGEKLVFDEDLVVPNHALSIAKGAVVPWAKSNPPSPLLHAGAELARPRLRLRPRNALGRASRGGAATSSSTAPRAARHPPLRRRPQELRGQEAVRRRHRQPQPPHAADRKRVDARGAVALPVVATRARPAAAPASSPNRFASRSPARTSPCPPAAASPTPSPGSAASRPSSRPSSARSPAPSSRKSTSASASSTMSGSITSTSTAPAARSRGGESQRIRLASQIGSGLSGVLYVLDEPSIGLHQKDNDRLLETLKRLRGLGNTVLVVEHDEDAIRHADHVIDMGPGAGSPRRRSGLRRHARRPARLRDQPHRRLPHRPPRDPAPRQAPQGHRQDASPSTAPPPTTSRDVTAKLPARHLHLRHRRQRLAASPSLTIDTLYAGRRPRPERRAHPRRPATTASRPRASRQGHRHRPVADRPHPALQPGDLHRRLHPDPRLVRRPPRKRRRAATSPAASASTSRAAAARRARATACSRSRCTSCPTSTSPATSATASATTARRSR